MTRNKIVSLQIMQLCVENNVCNCVNLKREEQVNVCLHVKNRAFFLRQKNKVS